MCAGCMLCASDCVEDSGMAKRFPRLPAAEEEEEGEGVESRESGVLWLGRSIFSIGPPKELTHLSLKHLYQTSVLFFSSVPE